MGRLGRFQLWVPLIEALNIFNMTSAPWAPQVLHLVVKEGLQAIATNEELRRRGSERTTLYKTNYLSTVEDTADQVNDRAEN
jgi:hypothetical protein